VQSIEWVFLDLGGVLYSLDYDGVLSRFCRRCGKTPADLEEVLHDEVLFRGYESGLISSEEFFQRITEVLNCDITFDEFTDIWNSLLVPRKSMFRLARRLKKQVGLLILSNTNEINATAIDPTIRGLSDVVVYSHRVGCLKPERQIYEKALELSGTVPERALFVDDRVENIDGARVLGINTHHFRDKKTLIRTFREYGL
jgi:HAD superfamily hydrolase (TIGR01509 family)